jgi:hypothetical protein
MSQKSLTYILSSLAALMFVIILILIGQKYFPSSTTIENQHPPVFAPTPISAASLIKYNGQLFEFEYPYNLTLSEEGDQLLLLTPSNNYIYVNITTNSLPTLAEYLKYADKVSQTAWEGQPSIQVQDTKITVINGLPCIQRKEYLLAADLVVTKTYFKKGSLVVSIVLSSTPGNNIVKDLPIYTHLLSTFKFTDSMETSKICGGLKGIACPDGYSCKYNGNYPDASGICVKLAEKIPTITSQELDMGWYYGMVDQKKPKTPNNWVYYNGGRSSCWHKPDVVCGYLPD